MKKIILSIIGLLVISSVCLAEEVKTAPVAESAKGVNVQAVSKDKAVPAKKAVTKKSVKKAAKKTEKAKEEVKK